MLTATKNFDSENPVGSHCSGGIDSCRAKSVAATNTSSERIDNSFCKR